MWEKLHFKTTWNITTNTIYESCFSLIEQTIKKWDKETGTLLFQDFKKIFNCGYGGILFFPVFI